MINNPKLPPKKGYVEVEVNGKRAYQKIPNEHDDIIESLTKENKVLKAQVAALTENQTFLENCLIEVGQVVYA